MSGTSLDGIDLAECEFESDAGGWEFRIRTAETIPYSDEWQNCLQQATSFSEAGLQTLNVQYTNYLAEVIRSFFHKNKIQKLDAVCSHGHTALHQPEKGITLQLGNLPELAGLIGEVTVCDFRVQDVALGGQGAPLVPIGDALLFGQYSYCINLGGFANLSFNMHNQRIAYDICPVNTVLNKYARQMGRFFDEGGKLAASGNLDLKLLQQLNALPFYNMKPPKSLGIEWVQQHVFPLLDASGNTPADILRTFTEHIAAQLALQFSEGRTVLVTGGGTYNMFLIRRLKALTDLEIVIPSEAVIDYKEALIFGLLGILKLREEVNCLASVTGAARDHSGGKIFLP